MKEQEKTPETKLKELFDSLTRGTSGRIILSFYEEEKMRELIETLFVSQGE